MKPRLYFSAEIGFSSDIPTYSGGLGVLAGDHLKAAADKCIPMVGITLLYRQGYFRQHLGADGWQTESYPEFMPEPLLKSVGETVSITLRGREVKVALWRTDIVGHTGGRIPIILLDSDVEGNHEDDRKICQRLYGGGTEDRLLQEAILGFAGVEAAQRLYPDYQKLHLNEGHTAFAPLALLNKGEDLDVVRANCHFTTHTPVPAGHDVFPWEMAEPVLGSLLPDNIRSLASEAQLSMSELALSLSSGANGVSELHGQVAREMFPGRDIGHVTNGVHHLTWVSDPMAAFFDRELTGWRTDAKVLRRATEISSEGLVDAHKQAKKQLLSYANAH
ncbi:alpha-glucan family phosphorylase, partial [Myxococcota bacterium]|nr:alpha-glucan family phosphorylase [Myxococcota bacterium]